MDRQSLSIVIDILIALLTGAAAVAFIPPFSLLAAAFCFAFVMSLTRARARDGRRRLAACGAIVSTVVFAGVVAAAAAYRPAKVVERQLNRSITLPATSMTLAELAYHSTYDRRGFPILMWISLAEADQDVVVEWPAEEISMREFLSAIEAQTALRHKFSHCGNGYTVLGGGDCSMGLSIFDPDFPREQFDVDAYAALRDAEAWQEF